jgi:hypothetical protein
MTDSKLGHSRHHQVGHERPSRCHRHPRSRRQGQLDPTPRPRLYKRRDIRLVWFSGRSGQGQEPRRHHQQPHHGRAQVPRQRQLWNTHRVREEQHRHCLQATRCVAQAEQQEGYADRDWWR